MSEPRQPSDFPALSRQDTVRLTLTVAGEVNAVEFQLESDPGVTGWKSLELRSGTGTMLNHVETQNSDHGPHSFSAAAADLVGATLTLAKARMFGVHTGMYELQNLSAYPGRSFQFLWQRDADRDGAVAGFFRDLGNGISTAVNMLGGVVEKIITTLAEVVSIVVETIGNRIADLLNALGNALGAIPVAGGFFRGAFRWLASVTSAAFDLGSTIIKGGLDLAAHAFGGITRMVAGGLGGLLAWDGRTFVKGAGDFASGIAGSVVAVAGKTVAFGQAGLFMQMGERPLTAAEIDILRRVYRKSVNLNVVRVIPGFAGVFSTNPRPFTLGNRIYMKNVNPATNPATLVHECCHVWQNQHEGTRYLTDALWAQATLPGQGYSWTDELARGHARWQEFDKEAQARFLDEIFTSGQQLPPVHTPGEFYDDDPVGPNVQFIVGSTDYTALARASVAYVRGAGVPVSRS